MLCNGERLGVPPTYEWPQSMGEILVIPGNNNSTNNNNNNAPTASSCSNSSTSTNNKNNKMIHAAAAPAAPAARVTDRPAQDQQAALKCPRCDSSNTKFCYYNNYSLSQPRHFCKACKRYWTRGGTLRNVPVGGGCRKNKRIRRPASALVSAASSNPKPAAPLMAPTNSIPPISLPKPASHLDPGLFYSLPAARSSPSSDVGLAFPGLSPRFDPQSVPNSISLPCTAFDLQHPQLNSLGLGFPSSHRDDEFNYLAQLSVMNDYPLFGSTAASLLVSSLKEPRKVEDYQALMPCEDLQASCAVANGNLEVIKEVKHEGDISAIINNRIEWQIPCENSFDAIGSAALAGDSSLLYWNAAIGAWPDSANCGSSVAPLI